MSANVVFSFENVVFSYFAFYSTLLIAKVFYVVFVIIFHRQTNKAFPNPEDAVMMKVKKPITDQLEVERTRRIHENDLENIPLFILLSIVYIMTGPSPMAALWHFRIYTGARIVHTISYQFGLQPFRSMSYTVGIFVTISLIVQILMFVPYW